MILIYVFIVVTIMVGGLLFFPFFAVVTAIVNNVEIPASMTGGWYDFVLSLRNWYLVLFVMIPLMLWVFVQSQKPERVIKRRR